MKNTGKKEQLVVIGNGMAGVACVEEILKLDLHRYEITIFGKEKHPNYNRVLLSSVLTGEKKLEDIVLNDFNWYEENRIKLITGQRITGLQRGLHVAICEDGTEVPYDKLILATGSVPFIPNIPGTEKEGVMSFRDISDCERIRQASQKFKKAVVIGGGLLGLEAAYGMLKLGMETAVVHLMGSLMERQLDRASSDFLKEDLEGMGIKIHLGRETSAILGGSKVEALKFKDGSIIDTDVVVMSAGIKANTELAESCGIYCEKGILVSDTMQTYDPSIYAAGECVQHRGKTFGLVAPIFEQAKVLANHLAGDGRLAFKDQAVSTRLKIPGIELYSAGNTSGHSGVDSIEYIDKGKKKYKRLFIRDNQIEGIILYGDTADSTRLFQYLIEGRDISEKRQHILFADSLLGRASASIDAMPSETIVCRCNGVTKGMIVEAIEKKGLFTTDDVKRETKAGSSCGGCVSIVDQILESVLGSSFQSQQRTHSLCECTNYTREDIIRNIRDKHLKSVMEVMDTLGWETVGCDKCRPALNYYVSMVWPKDYADDPTSRVVNERVHANLQKDGTFSVVPRMYGGATNPEELKRIADVAAKYGVPLIKLTGGQRIDLIGVKRKDLAKVWQDLHMHSGHAYGKALRTVKTCVGSLHCKDGLQDSLDLGIALEKKFEGLWAPAKIKLGVSGCPKNCAESGIKDIGIVGIVGGWEIYAGGGAGIDLRGGDLLCTVKSEAEVMNIVSALLQYYREDAAYGERTAKWIKRTGLEVIKTTIIEDLENRNSLCQRMDAALSVITDPWEKRTETVCTET